MPRLRTAAVLAPLVGAALAHATEMGEVKGRVEIRVDGATIASVSPMVAYLDGIDGPLEFDPPSLVPKISQKNARFSPEFLTIAAGQTVEMPNDDAIFHNVFSFSKPNHFDLGLYGRGESRNVTFEHPGVVRIYCSIHASMNATIFVAPSPWHARVGPSGTFEIGGVKPGRYRLEIWSPLLPRVSREIEIVAGRTTDARIEIAAAPAERR
jgi:plastocyanin